MKFVGEILGAIEGIQNFYIAGILIFLGLFAVILYRTIRIPKEDLLHYKTSILDSNDDEFEQNISQQ